MLHEQGTCRLESTMISGVFCESLLNIERTRTGRTVRKEGKEKRPLLEGPQLQAQGCGKRCVGRVGMPLCFRGIVVARAEVDASRNLGSYCKD